MKQLSQRKDISNLKPTSGDANVGLWIDRFLPHQLEEGHRLGPNELHPNTVLISEATKIPEPERIYKHFFERWEMGLRKIKEIQTREATVRGRLAVGLGNEGVLETAITLHRTYGVPYIPGSALKGLAATYAHRCLKKDTWNKAVYQNGQLVTPIGEAHKIMFGDTTSAGYVTFFDALYVPGSEQKNGPLWPDVITVHHPDYYQGKKDDGKLSPPADWDSPTPISFVSATGTYLIALAGPAAWVNKAFDILALALDEIGVGAKTSSGYGRLTLEGLDAARTQSGLTGATATEQPDQQPTKQQESTNPRAEDFRRQIPQAQKNTMAQYVERLELLEVSQRAKRALANELEARVHALKMRTKDKGWYQRLQNLREEQS